MSSLDARSAAELSAEASELILRDFLIKAGLDKTLATLNEECREKSRAAPTVEAWYEMSTAVRLPELLLKYAALPPTSSMSSTMASETEAGASRPVVEVLLTHLRTLLGTAQRQAVDPALLPQPSSPTLAKPQAPANSALDAPSFATNDFTNSYTAEFDPPGRTTNIAGPATGAEGSGQGSDHQPLGSPASFDSLAEPGYDDDDNNGAPMVAAMDSTGVRMVVGPPASQELGAQVPRAQHERKQRLVQTASSDPPMFELDPKPAAFIPPELQPGFNKQNSNSAQNLEGGSGGYGGGYGGGGDGSGNNADGSTNKTNKAANKDGGNSNNVKKGKKKKKKGNGKAGDGDDEDEGKHPEFYMSMELRERMLRRSLEVLRVNDQNAQKRDAAAQQQMAHRSLDELRKNHELESFQLAKKTACGLCEVKFSSVNLPVAVTLKAIYDLRHTWMLRRAAQLEQQQLIAAQAHGHHHSSGGGSGGNSGGGGNSNADPPMSSTGGAGSTSTGGGGVEGGGSLAGAGGTAEARKRVTVLAHNGALLQPTRSYDSRRVCSFCAQFFQQDEVYRPSFGAKLAALQSEKQHQEAIEDNKYWDPLMNPLMVLDTTSKKAQQRKLARHKKHTEERAAERDQLLGLDTQSFGGSSVHRSLESGSISSSSADASGSFFVAIQSKQRPGRAAVHGHDAEMLKTTKSKKGGGKGHHHQHELSLVEQANAKEADTFREAAAKSAFWHAAATDTLAVGGMGAFKKNNRDRNLAKPTVV